MCLCFRFGTVVQVLYSAVVPFLVSMHTHYFVIVTFLLEIVMLSFNDLKVGKAQQACIWLR